MLVLIITDIYAQKILLLENVNTLKNIKYYQGEDIMVKFQEKNKKITDVIYDVTDSTVIFELAGEMKFDDIVFIYRENWLVETLSGLSLLGGAAYFGIDSFNRLINHEYPVVDSGTLMISGGMAAFGLALIPFRYRKFSIGEKWKLRTIDLSSF